MASNYAKELGYFDDCLSAIDDMRDALRESLEKQWKTEQEKKQQMRIRMLHNSFIYN